MTYKCNICGQEFSEEEVETKIAVADFDAPYYICAGCFKQINEQMYAAQMANGGNSNILGNITEEAVKAAAADNYAKELRTAIAEETPLSIKEYLDEHIIGQENAKKILSVAIYNHYKRAIFTQGNFQKGVDGLPDEIEKSNVVMVGPSGVGKTAILKALSKLLDIPLAICDSTTLTEAGFVGADPETVVRQLYANAGFNKQKTEYGIIYLDEFDKLARKSGDTGMVTADPGHEGVQQALLKIVEGSLVSFTESGQRKHPDAPTIQIDTSNILFIVGGAFDGIDKVIKKRIKSGSSMGFSLTETDMDSIASLNECDAYNQTIDQISMKDLKNYGIIPEMLGRLPVICALHQLDEEKLLRILTEPKNSLVKQYKTLIGLIDHVSITFEEDALKAIAQKVIKHKTGARGLRTIIEHHLKNAMFEAPSVAKSAPEGSQVKIILTAECITDDKAPSIELFKKTA